MACQHFNKETSDMSHVKEKLDHESGSIRCFRIRVLGLRNTITWILLIQILFLTNSSGWIFKVLQQGFYSLQWITWTWTVYIYRERETGLVVQLYIESAELFKGRLALILGSNIYFLGESLLKLHKIKYLLIHTRVSENRIPTFLSGCAEFCPVIFH